MEILGIGYLGFESASPENWRDYAPAILGMVVGEGPTNEDDGSVYLKMDDHRFRLAFHPGPIDRVAYIGWETPGRDEFRAAVARFTECGVAFEVGDKDLRAKRGVRELICFRDPAGYRHELFYAPLFDTSSYHPPRACAGFDAGDKGVGHVVLISPEPVEEIERLFQDVMGFRFVTHGAVESGATFLAPKRNARSHCIAYAHIPGKMGIQHLGLPMASLDAVGVSYQSVMQKQIQMQSTLGRHTQDPVVSFYHFSPSGFIIETFWEEKPWNEAGPVAEINTKQMSLWGHETVGPHLPSTVREAAEVR